MLLNIKLASKVCKVYNKAVIKHNMLEEGTSLVAQMVKNLPAMQETWVQSLGWEDPLEEGMATHSSILALENPCGQRSLVGYSPRGHKESDTAEQLCTAQPAWRRQCGFSGRNSEQIQLPKLFYRMNENMVDSFLCVYHGNLQLSRSSLKMRSDKTRDYFILSYVVLLQEGGPLPGPKTGLLSNTRKWIVRGDTCWLSKRFYWEGHPGGEQEGKGTQESCSAAWLAVLGFMVMGLVSGWSLASQSNSESFLMAHASLSQDGC